jgi:hypothetical protein
MIYYIKQPILHSKRTELQLGPKPDRTGICYKEADDGDLAGERQ